MDLDAIVEALRGPLFILVWFVVMAFVLWKFLRQRRQERARADSVGRYDPREIIAIFQERRSRAFRVFGISLGLTFVSGLFAYLVGDKSVPIFSAAVIAAIVFFAFGLSYFKEVYRCPVCTRAPMTDPAEWEEAFGPPGGLDFSPESCRNCGAILH